MNIAVNITKIATIDQQFLGVQGEQVSFTVTVDSDIETLGETYGAYIDFLLPNGDRVWRGPYDCSSGSFTMTLGASDEILQLDGEVWWQFVLASVVDEERIVYWAAFMYKSEVEPSVCAVRASLASDMAVVDTGDYFTGTDVNTVLQEIGARLAALEA